MVDDDEENSKRATAIEVQVHQLYDILFHLADNLESSDRTFAVPAKGFESLAALLGQISQAVKEAERNAPSSAQAEGERERELRLTSEATDIAAVAANAAVGAVGAAAAAASGAADQRVAKRAVIAAVWAAGSAYRAAGVARGVTAAEASLPPEAQLEYHGEFAEDYVEEFEQWNNFCRLLFRDQELELQTSLYLQLSVLGRGAIAQAASAQWDSILEFLRKIKDQEIGSPPLDTLLKLIQSGNRSLKDLVRQYVLESVPFRDLAVLERVSRSDAAVALGLGDDADLRARNLRLRPDLFQGDRDAGGGGGPQCSICCSEEDSELVSGKIDQSANDDFLTFPGKFNGKAIKPLIDTGGGCNLIKAEWLRKQNIQVNESSRRFQTLLMADGSTSTKCPCVEVRWSFDGRKKIWTDVEFVVVEGYKYDALIGLPFLKHTETLHNSAGRLVFPEFKGVHAKKDSIPLYNFGVKAST
ncbi:uncharacterized protein A1O5_09190 [Cladophialophora psammophila CBS 110553]|uniref:Uncharacterized protein n=1 Tax=Cladophialophora psammophila CBS 110553 TaxID=1182543 RepID=W9XBN9_9EURO|nr:uncharacterized protein A1O5_09190 [Cladophialophora psammophila CBS 110553]EXJ67844.1 hypothetical protein A1O5_09190 [Cladophialophora psammophila CBS 110553]